MGRISGSTQSEIAALVNTPVEYDAIEPDGQSCVYMLVGPGPRHVDIDVFPDEDKAQWTAMNEDYPAWARRRTGLRSLS